MAARFNKVVLVTGLPRSASTMIFNAARILAGSSSKPYESYWINDFKWRYQRGKFIILKVHHFDPLLAKVNSLNLHTTRNLLEVACSITLKDEMPTYEFMQHIAEDNKLWIERANLVLDYVTIASNPHECIRQIAELMDIPTESYEDIVNQLLEIKKRQVHDIDPETQMHPNHISGSGKSWEVVLPAKFAEKIKSLENDSA